MIIYLVHYCFFGYKISPNSAKGP